MTLWALMLGDSYHDVCVSIEEFDEFFQAPEAALQAAQEELGKLIICSWRNATGEHFSSVSSQTERRLSLQKQLQGPNETSHCPVTVSPHLYALFSASLGGQHCCRQRDEPRVLFPHFCSLFTFHDQWSHTARHRLPWNLYRHPGLVDLARQPWHIPRLLPCETSLG